MLNIALIVPIISNVLPPTIEIQRKTVTIVSDIFVCVSTDNAKENECFWKLRFYKILIYTVLYAMSYLPSLF